MRPRRLGGEHKSPHHDGTRTGPRLTIARAFVRDERASIEADIGAIA